MRAAVDPLSRLGLPALSRPAPAVVPFFPFEMTGGSWPPERELRRGWRGGTRAAGGGPLSRLGMCGCGRGHCGGSLGGPREASSLGWESFRGMHVWGAKPRLCFPQHWAPPKSGLACALWMVDAQGCQLVFPSLRGG